MADRSNYADKPKGEYSPPIHKIFPHDFRKFTPHGGADGEHLHGHLGDNSSGDWSWKPYRDKLLAENIRTFRGVPPSAAELYRHTMHQPG